MLVIDDDPDIRELLCTVLADEGWDARPAANGREGLALLERWEPDLIVLDLMMPVMDGWTFAQRMRERWRIPIVVLSAATNVGTHAGRIGAVGVVSKPFDLDRLLPALADAAGGGTAS